MTCANTARHQRKEIVVIGASAAGMKAACRARRLLPDARVTVVEAGEYISYSACGLPFYLSGEISGFESLITTSYGRLKDPGYFTEVKDIAVKTRTTAVKIDRENREVVCENRDTGQDVRLSYDNLVIAAGASPIKPGIPGNDLPGVHTFTRAEDAFTLRKACEIGLIDRVAVVGSGFIGIELCEAFSALWGIDVTLFEREKQVLPGFLDHEVAWHIESKLREEGIEVHTNIRCSAIEQKEGKFRVITADASPDRLVDRVIFATGLTPNTSLARESGLAIGETGGIAVNDFLQTSDPAVYAAGDCAELNHRITGKPVLYPLGSLANRMGRIVGDNLARKKHRFAPAAGSSLLKAFDMKIGFVGLSADTACKEELAYGEAWGTFDDRVSWYPEAEKIFCKLVFDMKNEKVLGLQAVGKGDVMRRVDAVSALMQKGAHLHDLHDFEPAYSPPFSEPLDPLHYLAFLARGILHDGIQCVSPDTLKKPQDGKTVILDVRTGEEQGMFPLSSSGVEEYAIPVDQLRGSIDAVPRDRKVLVVCQRGLRSYEASLIVREHGYRNVSFLGGGYLFACPEHKPHTAAR